MGTKFDVVARVVLAIVRYIKGCETEIFYLKRYAFMNDAF